MQQIWNSTDRYPMMAQFIKVEHWETPDLYEISIWHNNAASQIPNDKLASIHMTKDDMWKLMRTLEEYLSYTEGKE